MRILEAEHDARVGGASTLRAGMLVRLASSAPLDSTICQVR